MDSLHSGQTIPSCRLLAQWTVKDAQPELGVHRIGLRGAQEPNNFFNIQCPRQTTHGMCYAAALQDGNLYSVYFMMVYLQVQW